MSAGQGTTTPALVGPLAPETSRHDSLSPLGQLQHQAEEFVRAAKAADVAVLEGSLHGRVGRVTSKTWTCL